MNSIDLDVVKDLIHQKKYSVITECARICHPDKGEITVMEYAGKGVRAYKDNKGVTRVLCPKDITAVQEGHVAQAIANGTIFDDSDEIDRNASMIERTSIPYDAMVNSGKCPPKHLKPMIAIVIGKMGDDGSFDVDDGDRTNGVNLIKDLSSQNNDVSDVVDNYLEKDKDDCYGVELGKEITGLRKDMDELCDTDPEDCVTDNDCCDSYDDFDIEALEKGESSDDSDDEEKDADSDDEESDDDKGDDDDDDSDDETIEESVEPEETGSDDADGSGDVEAVEESVSDSSPTEATTSNGSVNSVPVPMSAQTKTESNVKASVDAVNNATTNAPKAKVAQEGFLSKKPKKLKPIPRDIIPYITVEMNDIKTANDQAMLSGYTCSKIELVDFYITVLETQDARYVVPHNKQYLESMKQQLENLLAQILRIRPINRSEQIWRVNYPTN